MAFKYSDFGFSIVDKKASYKGFSSRGNSIFVKGMKRFEEKIQNPDQDLTDSVNNVFRQALNRNFKDKKNPDGTRWQKRLLRRASNEENPMLPMPRFADGKKYKASKKYWRSYLPHPLLNETGYMREMLRIQVETTPKTMRFKVFPTGKSKEFAHILNYGGVSRNKYSSDGKTVQKQRQFAYLNADDRKKITDLYSRYILDLMSGNR